jgi:hypothetical protein
LFLSRSLIPDFPEFWQFPLGDELVVARPDVQGLFLLNGTASVVWEEYRRGAPPAEIAQTFSALYGVPESMARRDIEAALAHWSEGLLSSPPAGSPARAEGLSRLRDLESSSQAVAIDCVLNGRGFRVLLEPGDLVEEIAPRLDKIAVPRLSSADSPFLTFALVNGEDRVFVFRDGTCIAEEEKTAAARAILLQEMTSHCDPGRETKAILHAGACGTAADCVILAGASHAGKSTLCAALMGRGLYCYSDDSAVLDREFRVSGMPFPVMVREESWAVLESRVYSFAERAPIQQRWGFNVRFLPSNLPGSSSPSAPVRALIFVEYRPGSAAKLEPLSAFEALLGLQQSGFWVEHNRESIARFLAWIQRLGRYKLIYSQIDEACDAVAGLLAAGSPMTDANIEIIDEP